MIRTLLGAWNRQLVCFILEIFSFRNRNLYKETVFRTL